MEPVQQQEPVQPPSIASGAGSGITVTPNEEPKSTIPYDTGVPSPPPLPQEVISSRAAKLKATANPADTKTYGDYYQLVQGGQEGELRTQRAAEVQQQKAVRAQEIISRITEQEGPMSAEKTQQILGVIKRSEEFEHPEAVFEVQTAKKYMDTLFNRDIDKTTGGWYNSVITKIPDEARKIQDVGEDLVAKRLVLQTNVEDLEAELKKQSWAGYGFDFAKGLVPFYAKTQLRGNVPDVGLFAKGATGFNVEEQRLRLLKLPMAEFLQTVKNVKENLTTGIAGGNPQAAHEWFSKMLSYPDEAKTADNLSDILNTVLGFGVGSVTERLATKGAEAAKIGERIVAGRKVVEPEKAEAVKEAVEATDSAVKNSTELDTKSDMYRAFVDSGELEVHELEAKVNDAVGKTEEAAVKKTTSRIAAKIAGTNDPTKDTIEALTSNLQARTSRITENVGTASREMVNRLNEQISLIMGKFLSLTEKNQTVNRTPGVLAIEDAVRAVKDDMLARSNYKGQQNAIIDIKDIKFDSVTNNYSADMIFGRHSGELFHSVSEARNFQQVTGLTGAKLERSGNGFYLRYNKSVNETDSLFQQFLLKPEGATAETGFWTKVTANWITQGRSAADVLSPDSHANRLIAAVGSSEYLKLIKENSLAINEAYSKIRGKGFISAIQNRGKWTDFKAVIKHSQDDFNPNTLKQGHFFETIGDLQDHYLRFHQRMPDPIEVEAYFQVAGNTEMLHALQNIQAYSKLHRLGVEEHSISMLNENGERVKSNWFAGKVLHELPKTTKDAIVETGNTIGNEKLYYSVGSLKQLAEDVKQGKKKIIEIANPSSRPLEGFGMHIQDRRIRFVIAKETESRPLSFNQLPAEGGIPRKYDYDHFIAQANVVKESINQSVRNIYEGDVHVSPMSNRAQGRVVAKHLDEVRDLIKNNKLAEAERYTTKNLPMGWDEVQRWFLGDVTSEGLPIKPRLNLEEAIKLIPRNQITKDAALEAKYGQTFVDGTQRSLAKQGDKRIAESEPYDLWTSSDRGSRGNPLWAYEPAETIDGVATLNRALTTMVSSRYMDDYKIFSVEHWLQRAIEAGALDGDEKTLRHSPFFTFSKPIYRKEVPDDVIRALEAERYQIQSFVGIPSKLDTTLHTLSQNLADTIYNKVGPIAPYQGVYDTIRHPSKFLLAAPWMIEHVTDPAVFMRSMVFHAAMGFFNPAQLLVQSATWANIYALGGRNALQGSLGATLHQFSRLNANPTILEALDKLAAKMQGFRPGQWAEARELLLSTGYQNVGREQILYNLRMAPRVTTTPMGQFLDAGLVFFNEAERNVRLGAWYTAYGEARKVKPVGAFTREEVAQIFNRADLMAGNMTRASASVLQSGPFSWTTQFAGYTLRLAEQMLGKRLTPMEKMRMWSTYAALFGFPTAMNMGGFPAGEMLKKADQESGYNINGPWGTMDNFLRQGALASMAHMITGDWYNIGPRLGSQGLDALNSGLIEDKSMGDMLAGAPGQFLSDAWKLNDGLRTAMVGFIKGNPDNVLKLEDAVASYKLINTFNNINKYLVARKFNEWIARNENVLKDNVSAGSAAIMATTGLQLTEVADTRYMFKTIRDEKNTEDNVIREVTKMVKRMNRAHRDGNDSEGDEWYQKAMNAMDIWGFPEEKRAHIWTQAMQSEPMVDRAAYDYYIKKPNEKRKIQSFETYRNLK